MTDILITKQSDLSVFVFEQENLAALPVPLGSFGTGIVQSLEKNKGDLNPVVAPDPDTNQYIIVDTVRSAPPLGTMTIMERVNPVAKNYLESIWRADCPQAMIIKVDCNGRSDNLKHFQSVYLIEGIRPNNLAHDGDVMSFTEDSEDGVVFTADAALIDWDRAFPILFGTQAADEVLAEIIQIIYADQISCGGCAPFSLGNNKIFALQQSNSGSPGLSAQIVYTLDGKKTWNTLDIAPFGGNSGNALTSAGGSLVIVSEAYKGHVVVPIDDLTTSAMIGVTTGYDASGGPRTIYPQSVVNILIGGAGGYIYKSADPTVNVEIVHDGSITTEDCNRIHGNGQRIVSVHDGGKILLSNNGGSSFSEGAAIVGDETTDLYCVWVVSQTQWYIGTESGKLYYTVDNGLTYTQRVLPNNDVIDAILDIAFSADSVLVGAVSFQKTDNTGDVYTTITGGRTWLTSNDSGIGGLPSNERINSVALFGINEIAAGGKQIASTDGLIAIAQK